MPSFDVLVVGSGIAGLTAAIRCGQKHTVALLTKGRRPDGSTNYAQGGIASVSHPSDKFEYHIEDTLEAGDGLCDPKRVKILASEGPNTINQLITWGVRFTPNPTNPDVPWHLALEGGHSHKRILHADDLTGKEIMRALLREARSNPNITFLENRFVADLLLDPQGNCIGAHVFHRTEGRVEQYRTQATVLCTGGAGEIFKHSTNPAVSTGDGIAVAFRAGATVEDLEFMQFHPTSLYEKDVERPFLISEAVRGYGGILKNHAGEEFMDSVHPLRSLAPRDVVARAIDAEMKRTGQEHMWLDITHRKKKDLKARFPNIFAKCLEIDIDISKDWIPVVPAAHYMCGGIQVDEMSRTAVKGLYACGEVACTRVHGANRLASNSLLESVVYSLRACEDILQSGILEAHHPQRQPLLPYSVESRDARGLILKKQLQQIMWNKVGIVRHSEGLQQALNEIQKIAAEVRAKIDASPACGFYHWEVRNMALVAELMIQLAMNRKESRGLHTTTNYPEKNPQYVRHFGIKGPSADPADWKINPA